MTRRHFDQVEVLRRDGDPARFLWHDRLYVVREVLEHWVESREWWPGTRPAHRASGTAPALAVRSAEREVWRVEAAAGRCAPLGVYDLCLDAAAGSWTLTRTMD